MQLSNTGSEEGFDRYIKFRGKEYDLSDRSVVWYFLLAGAMSFTFAVFAVFWFVLVFLWEGLNHLLQAAPQIGNFVAGLLSIWVVLGTVKYLLTGTASPFFNVDIDLNISTVEEEGEN